MLPAQYQMTRKTKFASEHSEALSRKRARYSLQELMKVKTYLREEWILTWWTWLNVNTHKVTILTCIVVYILLAVPLSVQRNQRREAKIFWEGLSKARKPDLDWPVVSCTLCWHLPTGPACPEHEADLAPLGSDPGTAVVSCHGLHHPQRLGECATHPC